MDPLLVLLHSLSGSLSGNDLTELKFLCRERVSKRKLERVQSGLDLFSVLLEQNDLERGRTGLLRELLTLLRRHDLVQRLDDYEAGVATTAPPAEAGGLGAGRGRGMGGEAWPQCTLCLLRPGWTLGHAHFFRPCDPELGSSLFFSAVPSGHSPTTCPTPVLTRFRPAVLGWKTQLRNGCG